MFCGLPFYRKNLPYSADTVTPLCGKSAEIGRPNKLVYGDSCDQYRPFLRCFVSFTPARTYINTKLQFPKSSKRFQERFPFTFGKTHQSAAHTQGRLVITSAAVISSARVFLADSKANLALSSINACLCFPFKRGATP